MPVDWQRINISSSESPESGLHEQSAKIQFGKLLSTPEGVGAFMDLLKKRLVPNEEWDKQISDYLAGKITPADFKFDREDFDKLSIQQKLDLFSVKDKLPNKVYRVIIGKLLDQNIVNVDDDTDDIDVNDFKFIQNPESAAHRLLSAAFAEDAINAGTMNHHLIRRYIEGALNNHLYNEFVYPKMENSFKSPLRAVEWAHWNDLKEGTFMIDRETAKQKKFTLPDGSQKSVAQIWNLMKTSQGEKKDMYEKILNDWAIQRVPTDSKSGGRILKLGGIIDRPGIGLTLHPFDMIHSGGADADGDTAFVYPMTPKAIIDEYRPFKMQWMTPTRLQDGSVVPIFREATGDADLFTREGAVLPKTPTQSASPYALTELNMWANAGKRNMGAFINAGARIKMLNTIATANGTDAITATGLAGGDLYHVTRRFREKDPVKRSAIINDLIRSGINKSADAAKGKPLKKLFDVLNDLNSRIWETTTDQNGRVNILKEIKKVVRDDKGREVLVDSAMPKDARFEFKDSYQRLSKIDELLKGNNYAEGRKYRFAERIYKLKDIYYGQEGSIFRNSISIPDGKGGRYIPSTWYQIGDNMARTNIEQFERNSGIYYNNEKWMQARRQTLEHYAFTNPETITDETGKTKVIHPFTETSSFLKMAGRNYLNTSQDFRKLIEQLPPEMTMEERLAMVRDLESQDKADWTSVDVLKGRWENLVSAFEKGGSDRKNALLAVEQHMKGMGAAIDDFRHQASASLKQDESTKEFQRMSKEARDTSHEKAKEAMNTDYHKLKVGEQGSEFDYHIFPTKEALAAGKAYYQAYTVSSITQQDQTLQKAVGPLESQYEKIQLYHEKAKEYLASLIAEAKPDQKKVIDAQKALATMESEEKRIREAYERAKRAWYETNQSPYQITLPYISDGILREWMKSLSKFNEYYERPGDDSSEGIAKLKEIENLFSVQHTWTKDEVETFPILPKIETAAQDRISSEKGAASIVTGKPIGEMNVQEPENIAPRPTSEKITEIKDKIRALYAQQNSIRRIREILFPNIGKEQIPSVEDRIGAILASENEGEIPSEVPKTSKMTVDEMDRFLEKYLAKKGKKPADWALELTSAPDEDVAIYNENKVNLDARIADVRVKASESSKEAPTNDEYPEGRVNDYSLPELEKVWKSLGKDHPNRKEMISLLKIIKDGLKRNPELIKRGFFDDFVWGITSGRTTNPEVGVHPNIISMSNLRKVANEFTHSKIHGFELGKLHYFKDLRAMGEDMRQPMAG